MTAIMSGLVLLLHLQVQCARSLFSVSHPRHDTIPIPVRVAGRIQSRPPSFRHHIREGPPDQSPAPPMAREARAKPYRMTPDTMGLTPNCNVIFIFSIKASGNDLGASSYIRAGPYRLRS